MTRARVDHAGVMLWRLYTNWRYWVLVGVLVVFGFWLEWATPAFPWWLHGLIGFTAGGVSTAWLIFYLDRRSSD